MAKNLSSYSYYKGEDENPFDSDTQNASHMFWNYERSFEQKFNLQNFTSEEWIPASALDSNEWESVLGKKPIQKDELFALWLFNLLMVRLPEKHQTDDRYFLNKYYDL